MKGNKKGFCSYFGIKKMTKENVSPLLSGVGNPVMRDIEKAEAFFTADFTGGSAFRPPMLLCLTARLGYRSPTRGRRRST